MLRIRDFTDMQEFERIISNWTKTTGLAAVAVDIDGTYMSECYNFTDFCMTLTRGSSEGRKRCEKCDQNGKGVYHCHAGLVDFGIDLVVEGEKVGSVIGGQVLPSNPDENAFRNVARDIGVDEEQYIEALHRVNVRSEDTIQAAAELLGEVMNNFLNFSYKSKQNNDHIIKGLETNNELAEKIKQKVTELNEIQATLQVLALNAKIEAVHAGKNGAGFSVVADEVGKLSTASSGTYGEIETIVHKMVETVSDMRNGL